MRIRLVQKPPPDCIDGVDTDRFEVGSEYDVGNTIGAVFLAEKWAVPAQQEIGQTNRRYGPGSAIDWPRGNRRR